VGGTPFPAFSATDDGGRIDLSGREGADPLETTEPGARALPSLPSYLEPHSRGFGIDSREFTFTQRYFWSRLFHPGRGDRLWGAGFLIGAAVLASGKRNIQAEIAESDTPERKAFFRGVQRLGDQGVVPGIALLFYLGGSTFRDYRAKETGFMLAESALLTGLLTVAGQWILNEDRPREGGRLHPFGGLGHGVSGHTSTAASISGVLSRMYLRIEPDDGRACRTFKRIGKGVAYGVPVLVAYARVNEQQHFAYNALLGLGIGFWVSHAVADAHGLYLEEPHRRWKPTSVGPITDDHGAPGIGARWEF
jgi:membrane-associated phospholipid phosphatase